MTELVVEYPPKMLGLAKDYRHKVFYGGRGGGKSHTVATHLILEAYSNKKRIFCGREIQNSIDESVYQLLIGKIQALGMESAFEVLKNKITCKRTGSDFLFGGLRHNLASKKSLEGVDIFWGEEAQTFSQTTLDIMEPTIRKPGSQMIWTFNPDLEDDPIYQMFIMNEHPDTLVQKINFDDNPWCPDVLIKQAEHMELTDPAKYKHIWLGECKQAIEGAIFAAELERVKEERRLTTVKPEPAVPVATFWDLGRSDNTAIWFAQLVGMEWRVLDYYQNNGEQFAHYLEVLDERGYRYGTHYLPHDAAHQTLAAHKSIEQQARDALRDNPDLGDDVVVVPRTSNKALAIDAARAILSRCVFDATLTKDGMNCLRRYHYAMDSQTGRISKEPKHDMHSHGADAFLTLAQSASLPQGTKFDLRSFYG